MDSLTQIVLGAATGEVILGKRLGNKALLLGAIGGTIPDLDVIYRFFDEDPARNLEVHRAYSHSIFTHFVIALPLAWLSKRWDKINISFGKWYLFWFSCLFTHALLDCCTTYGTQFFLPFTNYLVAFNNISVIDPLYTIPFLLILSGCLLFRRNHPARRKFLWSSIIISSSYMMGTFVLKYNAHQKFRNDLESNKIPYNELNTTPTIFNAVLWSATAFNDSTLCIAEYSYLKPEQPIKWICYERNLSLLKKYDSPALNTLMWFSDGNYFTEEKKDTLLFYNVKFGRMRYDTTNPEQSVIFYWKFYRTGDKIQYREMQPEDLNIEQALQKLKDRIGI
jgi:inner membrane protein